MGFLFPVLLLLDIDIMAPIIATMCFFLLLDLDTILTEAYNVLMNLVLGADLELHSDLDMY